MIDNKAIFNISYGLFVLVARQGDKDNACIINVAQQVTSDPLQLMICVNKQNLTHDMILSTLKFNLCPLSEEATMKPFQHFGFQSGKTVDKFAECETELRTDNGLRYLPKFINSVISCVVTKSIDLLRLRRRRAPRRLHLPLVQAPRQRLQTSEIVNIVSCKSRLLLDFGIKKIQFLYKSGFYL